MLSGIRVLDFGRYIAGPFCAALLADLGAEVIRIEPSGGADDRFVMPVTATGEGAMYFQVNRNKRSLTLNTDAPEAADVIRKLVAASDVVVANLVPALLQRIGIDYPTLKAIREDIILTSISAFDSMGPQKNNPGFDGTGQASSGSMYLTGTPGHPLRCAVSYVDYSTGLAAAYGTMAALFARTRTGQGQHVQSSLMQTALTMTNPMLIEEASGARSRVPTGNRSPISGPNDLFATQDGWILVQVAGQDMFGRWCKLVEREDLTVDIRFASDIRRGENGAALSEIMSRWSELKTTAEALEALRIVRIPACRVLSPAEALAQIRSVPDAMFDWPSLPGVPGAVPMARSPVRFSGMAATASTQAPGLGEHTYAVLRDAGYRNDEIDRLRAAGVI